MLAYRTRSLPFGANIGFAADAGRCCLRHGLISYLTGVLFTSLWSLTISISIPFKFYARRSDFVPSAPNCRLRRYRAPTTRTPTLCPAVSVADGGSALRPRRSYRRRWTSRYKPRRWAHASCRTENLT
ncbi:hypothetical protein HYPSUDRAFT_1021249 [Hypholoma sublateritium FD-334 SS-4]|uniref:Uncharacterized protein n=1 Tax=Hypholoma sublateritium (strain FD-334 SS-4) TaxID=945553 RepID=A0A0D2NL88_HYPSF|nr:hypothetical protein HYPSUDRAFT_1021249 [Hypholoma sublateritium FD-334 SS-4]